MELTKSYRINKVRQFQKRCIYNDVIKSLATDINAVKNSRAIREGLREKEEESI